MTNTINLKDKIQPCPPSYPVPVARPGCPRIQPRDIPHPQRVMHTPFGVMDIETDDLGTRYGCEVVFYAVRGDDDHPTLNNLEQLDYGEQKQRYIRRVAEMVGHKVESVPELFSALVKTDHLTGNYHSMEGLMMASHYVQTEMFNTHEALALDAFLRAQFEGTCITRTTTTKAPFRNLTFDFDGDYLTARVPWACIVGDSGYEPIEISSHPHWGLNFRVFAFLLDLGQDQRIPHTSFWADEVEQ